MPHLCVILEVCVCVQNRNHLLPKSIGQYTEQGRENGTEPNRTDTSSRNSIERMYVQHIYYARMYVPLNSADLCPFNTLPLKIPFFAFINYLYTSLCQPSPLQFASLLLFPLYY